MTTAIDQEGIVRIVNKHQGKRGATIAILEDIQADYNYLPEEALKIVSKETKQSLVDIYGVATFYKAFSLQPRGKHLVSVCLGTACHVRAAPTIAAEFQQRLGIRSGETTADREFTLETVNCLGACALGPIVVADGHYFSNVSVAEVPEIIEKIQAGLDKVEISSDERVFPLDVACPRCNRTLLDPEVLVDDYPSIRIVVSFGREHGSLRLSSLYGSFTVLSDHEIPMDTVMNFFCPHCHAELSSFADCPKCDARMVPLIVRGGGVVQLCSRRGCKEHRLDVNGVNL